MPLHAALHVLPTFVAVVDHGGIRKAAEKLALTHGAVSQQIQQLELAVGQPLFVRQQRRLQVNALGQSLYQLAQHWLSEASDWEKPLRPSRGIQAQNLKLTVLPPFLQHVLLPMLPAFNQRYPHITIEFDSSIDVRDLQIGGFDAAIRFGAGQWPGTHSQKLLDDAIFPAVAADVELAGKEPWRTQNVLQHSSTPWSQWLHQHRSDAAPVIAAEFADAGLLITAIEQGLGIGLVRRVLAQRSLQQKKLRAVGPQYASPHQYYLVWSAGSPGSPALSVFSSWLQQQCAQLAQEIFARR